MRIYIRCHEQNSGDRSRVYNETELHSSRCDARLASEIARDTTFARSLTVPFVEARNGYDFMFLIFRQTT